MAAAVKTTMAERSWLTLQEAADRIGAKLKTVRRWITEGVIVPAENGTRKKIALNASKPVGVWQVTIADLDAFCEARTRAAIHPCAVRANGEETEAASRRYAKAASEEAAKLLNS